MEGLESERLSLTPASIMIFGGHDEVAQVAIDLSIESLSASGRVLWHKAWLFDWIKDRYQSKSFSKVSMKQEGHFRWTGPIAKRAQNPECAVKPVVPSRATSLRRSSSTGTKSIVLMRAEQSFQVHCFPLVHLSMIICLLAENSHDLDNLIICLVF